MERLAYAFRWRPEHPCGADDLVRIIREPGLLLVVMAGAGEDGFSVCWAPGSRLALDLFADAWAGTSGEITSRLENAIGAVRERYVAGAGALQKYVPEDDMGGPHATVTALALSNDQLAAVWVGGDVALCTGGSAEAWTTTPHDLKGYLETAGRDDPEDAEVPDVLTRIIGEDCDSTPAKELRTVRAGDVVVLTNRYVHRRLGRDAIASIAFASVSPLEAAEELVRLAYEDSSVPYAAACVVRI